MKKQNLNNYLLSLLFGLFLCAGPTQADTITQWSVINRTNFDLTNHYAGSELPYHNGNGVKIHIQNIRALYGHELTGIISNIDLDPDIFNHESEKATAIHTPSILDINVNTSWNGSIVVDNNTYWLQPITCRINSENASTTINIYRKQNGDFWVMIISKSTDGTTNSCHAPLRYMPKPCKLGSRVGRYGDMCPL